MPAQKAEQAVQRRQSGVDGAHRIAAGEQPPLIYGGRRLRDRAGAVCEERERGAHICFLCGGALFLRLQMASVVLQLPARQGMHFHCFHLRSHFDAFPARNGKKEQSLASCSFIRRDLLRADSRLYCVKQGRIVSRPCFV